MVLLFQKRVAGSSLCGFVRYSCRDGAFGFAQHSSYCNELVWQMHLFIFDQSDQAIHLLLPELKWQYVRSSTLIPEVSEIEGFGNVHIVECGLDR